MATVLTRSLHAELRTLGCDTAEIARRTGLKLHSVKRAEHRHGYRGAQAPTPTPRPKINRQRRLRAIQLIDEGMPSNWVAEDVAIHPGTIRRLARKRPNNAHARAEWSSVWQSIRQNPELYALHSELRPKK